MVGGFGGIIHNTKTCYESKKITGLKRYSWGKLIRKISFICHKPSRTGEWTVSGYLSATPTRPSPILFGQSRESGEKYSLLSCPKNMFVGSVRGRTTFTTNRHVVLNSIGLGCYTYRNGRTWGNKTTVYGGANESSDVSAWSSWKNCPHSKVAYEAR